MYDVYHTVYRRRMRKYAGQLDRKRMRELSKKVRPGDLVNFELHTPDAFKHSFKRGLRGATMKTLLGTVTGDQYHTAIVGDVDKKNGEITLVETHMSRGAYVMTPKELLDNARFQSLHFYRPPNASAEAGRRAARQAIAAAGRKLDYPMKDLITVGLRDIAEQRGKAWRGLVDKLDTASAKSRKVSDEAMGVCSQLGAYAWGKALGDERAFVKSLGVRAKKGSRIAVSPGTIARAAREGRLKVIGVYEPKNRESSVLRAMLGTSRGTSGGGKARRRG
jgi:hypothetical protein